MQVVCIIKTCIRLCVSVFVCGVRAGGGLAGCYVYVQLSSVCKHLSCVHSHQYGPIICVSKVTKQAHG